VPHGKRHHVNKEEKKNMTPKETSKQTKNGQRSTAEDANLDNSSHDKVKQAEKWTKIHGTRCLFG
jgi:hypothetical protein